MKQADMMISKENVFQNFMFDKSSYKVQTGPGQKNDHDTFTGRKENFPAACRRRHTPGDDGGVSVRG
jgi:hypothetical protein